MKFTKSNYAFLSYTLSTKTLHFRSRLSPKRVYVYDSLLERLLSRGTSQITIALTDKQKTTGHRVVESSASVNLLDCCCCSSDCLAFNVIIVHIIWHYTIPRASSEWEWKWESESSRTENVYSTCYQLWL